MPDTVEDLSQFVLVNEERVQALRAQIRAIKKAKLAKDVYEQKLAEAQEIGQITVEAAQKMGELLLTIQKQSGARTDLTSPTDAERFKTKGEITADMGMTSQQVSQYQQMALHPEAVKAAVQKAIDNGDVVSRSQVMKQIRDLQANKRALEEQNEILKKQVLGPKVVPPKDYSEVKAKAKAYDAETKRLNTKLEDAYKKRNALEDEIRELKEQTARERTNSDAVAGAIYFIAQCGSFIRDVGGYVWLADKIADLPPRECEGYIKAAMAVRDWATVLLQNIERNDYGKQEIARINAESTAE